MEPRLHLRAEDAGDIPAFSALVQDFVAKAADIGFDAKGRRLVLLGNRFCWETGKPRRTRSAILLSSLLMVQRRAWPEDPHTTLELLAIDVAQEQAGATLTLHFAGGAAIRATAECIDLLLDDLTGPWPTPRTPGHDAG